MHNNVDDLCGIINEEDRTGNGTLRDTGSDCQGSVLFTLFVAPVAGVITPFGVLLNQFADGTQLYIKIDPSDTKYLLNTLDRCSCAVHDWFTHNGLSLNPAKSEILFMDTRQQVDKINCSLLRGSGLPVLGCVIAPSDSIKSPGVRLDKNPNFNQHIDSRFFHHRETVYIQDLCPEEKYFRCFPQNHATKNANNSTICIIY